MKRFISFLLLAALLLTCTAFADYDIAVVNKKGVKVFRKADLSGKSVKLKRFTALDVESVNGNIVTVKYKGRLGYMRAGHLELFDSSTGAQKRVIKKTKITALPSGGKTVTVKAKTAVTLIHTAGNKALVRCQGFTGYVKTNQLEDIPVINYDEYDAKVIKATLKVFKKPKTSSKVVSRLKKDDVVRVTATSGDWAKISCNGVEGYVKLLWLTKYEPIPKDIFNNDSYSNEEKIYYFMKYEMKLSTASACGILSNINAECSFNPDCSYGGSYGICQWLGGRLTNLKNFCSEKGYDYKSLEGQCWFMYYELQNSYSAVYSKVKAVDNTAQGAYDAAYEFCYNYEIPRDRSGQSAKRGAKARDTYFPKYSK